MKHSGRAAVAMMRMIGCSNNGRFARNFLHSDCVIDEKTVVLQKKDNEGFGFVLRGAKGRRLTDQETHSLSQCLYLPCCVHVASPVHRHVSDENHAHIAYYQPHAALYTHLLQ